MEDPHKNSMSLAIITVGIVVALLIACFDLWNENSKLKDQLKEKSNVTSVITNNGTACSPSASIPAMPSAPIVVYKQRDCTSNQAAKLTPAPLFSTGSQQSVDEERLRELAQQADLIVESCR